MSQKDFGQFIRMLLLCEVIQFWHVLCPKVVIECADLLFHFPE